MARSILAMKKIFISNVKELVEQCVTNGVCNLFKDFKTFKKYLADSFDVEERAIDYYFSLSRETMPDISKLDFICDTLYTDMAELFESKDVFYNSEEAFNHFIENILYFLDSDDVKIVESTETSAMVEITDEKIRDIVMLYDSAKKLKVDITSLISSVINEVAETSYYFNGKLYIEDYVRTQYIFHTPTTKQQEWSDMTREQKIQFWNSYCSEYLLNS